MTLIPALVAVGLLLPHGGQYLPPHPDPGTPGGQSVVQPGYGPFLEVQPDHWEWWFDFNREEIVDARRRMTERAAAPGSEPFLRVDDEVRRMTVLPVLLGALEHHNRDVRATAVEAVARLGLSSSIPAVVERTRDKDLFVRTQAVLALGLAHGPVPTERLATILRDADQGAEIRLCAAVALGLLATPEATQTLARLLKPKVLGRLDHQLEAGLVYAAGVSGDAMFVPALETLAQSWLVQQDARLRALLAVALGRIGDARGLDLVLDLLVDQDNQVRRSAAAALEGLASHVDPERATRILAQASKESDLPALGNLIHALGRIRLPTTRAFLQQQFGRSTTLVRPHVALALGLDGDPGHAPILLRRLPKEHELSARAALLTALALLHDPATLPLLREELAEARAPVYVAALCRAAGLLGEADPGLVERLDVLAREVHDVEVTRLAILGLGLLGARTRLTAMATSASEVPGTVDRAARVYALGQVGDRSTLAPLLALAQDERQPSYVIAYCLQALGEICDPRPRSPGGRLSRFVDPHHDVSILVELYRLP